MVQTIKMLILISAILSLLGQLRCDTCLGTTLLKYENVNCGGGVDCPNTFKCIKGECCEYKDVPKCDPELHPITKAPWACKGGGSKACSPGYDCYEHDKNIYSMCCLNVTCVDPSGYSHRWYDKEWKSNEDKCNKCNCLKNGEIKCTDKKGCKKCKTQFGIKRRGFQYWKDECTQCTCVSKVYTPCTTPCERGIKGPFTDYTPCDPDSCDKQIAVQQCFNATGENGISCTGPNIAIRLCNETKKDCSGRPGQRLTEKTSIIIGGEEVFPEHNFPWVVFVDSQSCGGSLISPRHVLTAAHCVVRIKAALTLKTGKHDKTKTEAGEQYRAAKISNIIVHEDYNDTTSDNDIAIIIVDPPIKLDRQTQTILLPTSSSFSYRSTFKKECHVAGWGRTHIRDWRGSNVLLHAVIEKEECRLAEHDLELVTDNMFCASSPGKDSCFGDSGGPFMCRDPKTLLWTQYGIVSWGPSNSCGELSGVYTKVTNYIDWINNIISTDGGWGNWTSYTDCANGVKSRARICTNPEPIGSGTCNGTGRAYKDEETGLYVDVSSVKC